MSRFSNRRFFVVAWVPFAVLLAGPSFAQRPGTITGKVFDVKTGGPLGYANIVLLGTGKGTITMDDGRFELRRVPVGTYSIKVMMMGFKPVVRHNIAVDSGKTVDLDFALEETIVAQTPVITVLGEQPQIDVTSSDRKQGVTKEQFEDMPLDDIIDVLGLKTGVVKMGEQYMVRGGRPDETQYQIDGVIVNDPLIGVGAIDVNRMAAAGAEMISGGMDAEYGNAQSAIFTVNTREGGRHFGGEFRYMTDDFGRSDKTYTNYDNVSLGLGGPTWWPNLRYFVSGEATFQDGENVSVEPKTEHKGSGLLDWLKARERMSHQLNLQSKLTWSHEGLKLSGEAIYQGGRYEEYHHNWNVDGYVSKIYYFQRLRPTGTGHDVYAFGGIAVQFEGPWLENVRDPARAPNPRPVTVEQLTRDPETGEQRLITHTNFRAVDVGGTTILWDEAVIDAGQVRYKPWVLFEGFQFPFSRFSHFPDDTSYVAFNSAERTPEVKTDNMQLKLGINHNVSDDLLYTMRLSRLEFNRSRKVGDKAPDEYDSAGLPTTLPDGTYLEGGVSQAVWYTDPDNPYFVTAYDFPYYLERKTVQYLFRGDVTAKNFRGHRTKFGLQLIYNDLNNDERLYPAQRRINPDGSVQQGANVNVFHNYNSEGALYAQDKWEYEGLVANFGVRFEYFSTGNLDNIEINSSEIERDVDRYKTNWSPRLGIAFPISDRDKFFFHYGHYTQWPSRAYIFATQDAIATSATLGNPNLDPELTVSYQAGVAHQFTNDIAANFVVFYKDIFGLVSSTRVTDDSTGLQSWRYINKTYASARGLEVSLEKSLRQRVGFELYYTYSFADGVASDADFGRSAVGLTHLPTDELPLNWDRRHSFNATLRLADRNNWGASVVYQYGSALPWTPYDRFARAQDPKVENSKRLPDTHRLDVQARKRFNIYGRDLTLFVEGRNLLDQDILQPGGTAPTADPPMVVARMDQGSYLTETGRYGGAYVQDIDDDGINDFVPVQDPTIWEPHRSWRIGLGFQF